MKFRAGTKVTGQDTHRIDMTLKPPDQHTRAVRGGNVEDALVDAIITIRTAMTYAAAREDPWDLSAGTVDITFGVTRQARSRSAPTENWLTRLHTHYGSGCCPP